jgi:V8-like Glu-specific endopeptidase
MLIIKHLTGPLAGTENRFEDNVDRIVFGRQLDCQVVYPPEYGTVARHHFALVRKPSGHWTLDLFGGPFVAVNGTPADPGEPVPADAKIELGHRGGPSFAVVMPADQRADNLVKTEFQEQDESPRKTAARAWRIAAAGVVVAVLAVGGVGISHYLSSAEATRFQDALARLAQVQARDANLRIDDSVRAHLAKSVYVVALRDKDGRATGAGTAWPVGPRLLATNGHVAVLRHNLQPGESMIVRSPGQNGKTYTVTGDQIHPGYGEFMGFVARDPIFVAGFRGNDRFLNAMSNCYDVALLKVDEDLPAGDVFELATADDLAKLDIGSVIATAGYPMEGISGSSAQVIAASPDMHVGTVTAVTDFFALPANVEQRRLIHHDLPATGGQSGSPIVGPNGRVVALLNAGNVITQQGGNRAPSAALINYGQRVDMLRDLMSGEAENRLVEDRKYWAQQIAFFKRGIDVFIPEILKKVKPSPESTPEMATDQTFTLNEQTRVKRPDGSTQRQLHHAVPISAGAPYAIIAYAQNTAHIEMYVVEGSEVRAKATEMRWYPYISVDKQANDRSLDVWIVSPKDEDMSYTLRVYRWRPGAAGA